MGAARVIRPAPLSAAAIRSPPANRIGNGLRQRSCDRITAVKIVPEGYEADEAHSLNVASRDPSDLPLDMLSLATFLHEDEIKTRADFGVRR
jgi:hypothetical protein